MIESLCLSFMALSAASASGVPPQVAQLAKSRVHRQFHEAHPDMTLEFDESDCPNKGSYEFGTESLSLSAENALWNGKQEYSLSDLIEGKKIDFPLPQGAPRAVSFRSSLEEKDHVPSAFGRFIKGAGLGALSGAAGGMLLSPDAQNRNLNGLVFGLSGALLGGMIAVIWNH